MHPSRRASTVFWIAATILIGISAVPRFGGMSTDLWQDEVWSVRLARQATGVSQVFVGLHHSNNHYLNTLVIHLLGPQKHWSLYRLLSLIGGVLTVALAGVAARRDGRAGALIAMLLCGFSYMLVHYSTEARGYAAAACCGVGAMLVMERFVRDDATPSRFAWAAAFWLIAILGILSHQTFIYAWAGVVAGSALSLLRRYGRRILRALVDLIALHGPPGAFFAWLYFADIKGQETSGGDAYPLSGALSDLICWTFGLPIGVPIAPIVVVACAVAVLFTVQIFRLVLRGDDRWLTLLCACIIAPGAAIILISRAGPFFWNARYFMVVIPLILIALGGALGAMWDNWKASRILVAPIVAIFVFGNAVHLSKFYRDGRGQYLGALRYIAQNTPGDVVPITGDQQFRTTMMLDFYNDYLPSGKRVEYTKREDWPTNPPLWILRQSFNGIPRELPATTRLPNT
ncbi:MAG: hypothetical protein ACREJC_03805, partial [Tepidisphaeraceae bacterium]